MFSKGSGDPYSGKAYEGLRFFYALSNRQNMKQSLLILLIVLLLYVIFYYFIVFLPKFKLQKGLQRLGDMKGKTKQEIINEIGEPKVAQRNEVGQTLTWSAKSYGIQMLFDNQDNFIKILQEVTT